MKQKDKDINIRKGSRCLTWHLFILKDQKKNHATLRYSDQACAIDTWVMEFLTSNYYRTLVINLRHKSVAKSKDQEKNRVLTS